MKKLLLYILCVGILMAEAGMAGRDIGRAEKCLPQVKMSLFSPPDGDSIGVSGRHGETEPFLG